MRIVLVHGFRVSDGGRRSIDRLAPALAAAGHIVDVDQADYGFLGFLRVRFMGRSIRRRLAAALQCADAVVTHSNGANFVTKVLRRMHHQIVVVHISPALNRNTEPPASVTRQLVLYTRHDIWVRLSTFLLFHPWGRMGARGYSGDSPKVTNESHPEIRGHSAWFSERWLPTTTRAVLEFLQ